VFKPVLSESNVQLPVADEAFIATWVDMVYGQVGS
jgi:hypothetical protein